MEGTSEVGMGTRLEGGTAWLHLKGAAVRSTDERTWDMVSTDRSCQAWGPQKCPTFLVGVLVPTCSWRSKAKVKGRCSKGPQAGSQSPSWAWPRQQCWGTAASPGLGPPALL